MDGVLRQNLQYETYHRPEDDGQPSHHRDMLTRESSHFCDEPQREKGRSGYRNYNNSGPNQLSAGASTSYECE